MGFLSPIEFLLLVARLLGAAVLIVDWLGLGPCVHEVFCGRLVFMLLLVWGRTAAVQGEARGTPPHGSRGSSSINEEYLYPDAAAVEAETRAGVKPPNRTINLAELLERFLKL